MKKLLSFIISLVIVFAFFTNYASATVVPPTPPDTPMYTYITEIGAGFSPSNGTAQCSSFVTVRNSSCTIRLNMYLQYYTSNGWVTQNSWSTSGTYSVALGKSAGVISTYVYRVHAVAYVYNSSGTLVETATANYPTY